MAQRFVTGWLTRNPERRKALLDETATPDLAAELMLTAPEMVPATKLTKLDRLGESELSAEFVARLANGDAILVALSADPQAAHGWAVEDVEAWT